jgi:hypothetical protein
MRSMGAARNILRFGAGTANAVRGIRFSPIHNE